VIEGRQPEITRAQQLSCDRSSVAIGFVAHIVAALKYAENRGFLLKIEAFPSAAPSA
jgi:hypothetical protein